ncbi:probable ATP-dependent RNA helicase DDX46 [Cyanistes caeruleus]|uniref:probable ATP-dependent RNA helicase DDX46 n=1 Tax=Cyanistes caeruleus TaxID=156563 RepID=UPI000CDA87BF|nr:probable ATP-dependent RNA helicase DDX46 [Cyanistes caeruleus]
MRASYPCLSLHGGIDQYDRDSIINDFKNGTCKLLVATSVAARGLDVKQLMLVVNYSCPNHYEDYVHRAGRTGRAGNKVCTLSYLVLLVLAFFPLLFDEVAPRDSYRGSSLFCWWEECF